MFVASSETKACQSLHNNVFSLFSFFTLLSGLQHYFIAVIIWTWGVIECVALCAVRLSAVCSLLRRASGQWNGLYMYSYSTHLAVDTEDAIIIQYLHDELGVFIPYLWCCLQTAQKQLAYVHNKQARARVYDSDSCGKDEEEEEEQKSEKWKETGIRSVCMLLVNKQSKQHWLVCIRS